MAIRKRCVSWMLVASSLLAGCGGGGGGGGAVSALSLAGTVLDSAGLGIQDVVVRVQGATTAQSVSDANGNFIVLHPPTGLVALHIEADSAPGGTFPNLAVPLVIGGGANNLTQPIVLPDLSSGGTMSVAVDAQGHTLGAATINAPDGSTLDIADMTTITVDGAIPAGPVTVNITPVAPINVPMPLPGSQNAGAFVTIQPPGASFDPPLDLTLPNTLGLAPGAIVDIWSFDHDLAAWVDRSAPPPGGTGNHGVVDVTGTTIVASGVITKGGWHSGALPVVASCATTISGQVQALGTTTGVADVLISLSSGQFAHTDSSGHFTIALVPAYDAAMAAQTPAVCVPADVTLRAQAPVSFGSMLVTRTIPSGLIVTGGTTTLPALDIQVNDTGSLVGSVTDHGQPVQGTVALTGTATQTVDSDSNGAFFVAALAPGPYTATFPFTSGDISANFTIVAHQTTLISLSAGPPPTGGALIVKVLSYDDVSSVGVPVAGANVTLVGAGGASFPGVTDAGGSVTYASTPNPPYTVTAQKDTTIPTGIARQAATLVGVDPTASPRTLVVPFFTSNITGAPVITDTTLNVTVTNAPAGVDFSLEADTRAQGGFNTDVPFFLLPVGIPSGMALDVAVRASDSSTGELVSAVVLPNVTATSGQNLVLNVDFATAVQFDQPVSVTYTNTQPHTEFFATLELHGVGELIFDFSDFTSFPATPKLPDLSASKLSGFTKFFDADSNDSGAIFEESDCFIPLGNSTPATLQASFLGTPTIQSPLNNSTQTTYGPGSVVQYTLGSGNGTTSGINSITIAGESASGNLSIFWDVFAPPTSNALTLPPVDPSQPMFAAGFYAVNVGAVRFPFPGFTWTTFFDQNFSGNLAASRAVVNCEGDTSHFFQVATSSLVRGAQRAALLRRAASRNLFAVRREVGAGSAAR